MNIQKVIKKQGFTIKDVADKMYNTRENKVGVSQGSLSTILNGNPTIDKLQEIASIIGVSVSELVADEKDVSNTIICPHCGEKIVLETKKEPNNTEK